MLRAGRARGRGADAGAHGVHGFARGRPSRRLNRTWLERKRPGAMRSWSYDPGWRNLHAKNPGDRRKAGGRDLGQPELAQIPARHRERGGLPRPRGGRAAGAAGRALDRRAERAAPARAMAWAARCSGCPGSCSISEGRGAQPPAFFLRAAFFAGAFMAADFFAAVCFAAVCFAVARLRGRPSPLRGPLAGFRRLFRDEGPPPGPA